MHTMKEDMNLFFKMVVTIKFFKKYKLEDSVLKAPFVTHTVSQRKEIKRNRIYLLIPKKNIVEKRYFY